MGEGGEKKTGSASEVAPFQMCYLRGDDGCEEKIGSRSTLRVQTMSYCSDEGYPSRVVHGVLL